MTRLLSSAYNAGGASCSGIVIITFSFFLRFSAAKRPALLRDDGLESMMADQSNGLIDLSFYKPTKLYRSIQIIRVKKDKKMPEGV